MTLLTQDKIKRFGGYEGLKKIYEGRSLDKDCKYYVHDKSEALGVFGFYTDKFIVGGPYKGSDVVDLSFIKDYIITHEMREHIVVGQVKCKGSDIFYKGYKVSIFPDEGCLSIYVDKVEGDNPLSEYVYQNLEDAFKAVDWEVASGKNT